MSSSSFIAPFAVSQSTTDVDAQIEFYTSIEYVVDIGYDALEDIPEAWFTGHGVSSKDLVKSVALRLPHDPYMHLILFQWKNLKTTPGWPAPFNQVGSRGLSLLVSDLDSELQRIRQEFPQLKVLHEPVTVRRKWGRTTSVLLVDPAGVFCDLIEIEKDSPYDPSRAKAPPQGARTWLHFMLNTENEHYPELSKFYRSFGTEHDNGVDFRPNVGFHPFGPQHFIKQMEDAFEYDLSKGIEGVNVGFLRKVSDPSSMHIELMGYPFGVQDPTSKATWAQKGISRYCIKTKDYAGSLAKAKTEGRKIYIEDQRGCLNWGDSQWFFMADTDGNIVTLEEWFPQREWGEKE